MPEQQYLYLFVHMFTCLDAHLPCVSLTRSPIARVLPSRSSVQHFLTLSKFSFADQLFLLVCVSSFLIPSCEGCLSCSTMIFPLCCVQGGWVGGKLIGIFVPLRPSRCYIQILDVLIFYFLACWTFQVQTHKSWVQACFCPAYLKLNQLMVI